MEPVTLTTERLLVRPFVLADAQAVYEACQDPDIQFYTPTPSPYRLADAEKWVGETAPRAWATDEDYNLGAFRLDDGAFVGAYCLTRKDPGLYELGYWAAKEQRGRGFSTEAARALCEWGFATLAPHRIEWWAMAGNTASRALAESLGFTVEGTLRRRTLVDGKPWDWWVGGLFEPPTPSR
jgi:RimJ/RimL family protein N-acetyltransferase